MGEAVKKAYWELHSLTWKLILKPYLDNPSGYDWDKMTYTAQNIYNRYRETCGDQYTCQEVMLAVRKVNEMAGKRAAA